MMGGLGLLDSLRPETLVRPRKRDMDFADPEPPARKLDGDDAGEAGR